MKIQVDRVNKSYGKTHAANDVSFEFSSGMIYGFIGPNGAGKTTTIKVMSTLEEPDSGDVFLDGISTLEYPDKVRAMIGYMPDSLPAFNDIQVWEYLDFFARSFGLKGDRRRRMLSEVEEFTSLGEIRNKFLSGLSKGMKQRVSLARALIHDPAVLLLDEPAAGLDPRARLELRNLLKILSRQGKAILLSSHILSELQDICDGAVIIEQGKVLAAGRIDDIIAGVEKSPGEERKAYISLVIKILGDAAAIRDKILEDPGILTCDAMGQNELHACISGTDADIPATMGRLFAAGLPIIGFNKQHIELEEVFMRVTSGRVQ